MAAAREGKRGTAPAAGGDGLVAWAARSGGPRAKGPARGGVRFVFYGRVSTEDWQDPVTSRARQREQAEALVRGHGQVVAEFFDAGQSRTVAWGRRPRAAALVAQLADPGRGWDAIVVGEYERASTAASTRRWRRCSSITACSCGCRRRAAGSISPRSMTSGR